MSNNSTTEGHSKARQLNLANIKSYIDKYFFIYSYFYVAFFDLYTMKENSSKFQMHMPTQSMQHKSINEYSNFYQCCRSTSQSTAQLEKMLVFKICCVNPHLSLKETFCRAEFVLQETIKHVILCYITRE